MTDVLPCAESIICCFNCTLQIQSYVYIKCAECDNFVCIPCFQFGAESGRHKRGHNYEVIHPSIYRQQNDWNYEEEERLLSSMHRFKMGNWGEIVESMDGNRRLASQAQQYFDKVFVRGWIGQFAIREKDWGRNKFKMFCNQQLAELVSPTADSIERLLLIFDALLDSEEELSENAVDVEQVVQRIVRRYTQRCFDKEIQIEWSDRVNRMSTLITTVSEDEYDPTDEESERSKLDQKPRTLTTNRAIEEEMNGLEMENDSDEEEPISPAPITRQSERLSKSGLRNGGERRPSSARIRNSKPASETYRRVQRLSSSEDEELDMNSDSADETTVSALCNDNGLEQEEESSVADESEYTDSPDIEPVIATPPTLKSRSKRKDRMKTKKRKPRKVLPKKQRRLIEYGRRIQRRIRQQEQKLEAVNNLCPLSVIRELRDEFPKLVLEEKSSIKERPKLRQDDITLLAYNVDREEFECDWFNDAEQLISRLTISPPTEKNELLDIENDIKFARLQHYIRIMSARRAKRRAIIEHDKITEFFNFMITMSMEKRTTMEVVNDRTKVEALLARTQQFLTKEEYKGFVDMLDRLEVLMDRIRQLQTMQRNGETSLRNYTPTIISSIKRKRKKTKHETEQRRKAELKWQAYKRWQKNQLKE